MAIATERYETLGDLMHRVIEEAERKRDLVADTRRMSFVVDEEENECALDVDLDEGEQYVVLNNHALGQLSADLGIPRKYFDRMRDVAPRLLRSNVQHWLHEEPNRRMIRSFQNGGMTGRAWLSDGYRRLDNIEIARTLLPEFENLAPVHVRFHSAAVTDTRLYVRALFPDFERDVKVGDPVTWGVEIRNSEVGAGALAINGFVLRLVCVNGMTVTSELSARHVGRRISGDGIFSQETVQADDAAFWLAARDTLRAAISETRFDQVVETLRETTEGTPVQRPILATEELASTFSLTEEERERVLLNLMSEGDMTRWGMLNAITTAAKDSESFDRQAEMEGLGWSLATVPVRQWEKIALAS
jgi:hypothetical protein